MSSSTVIGVWSPSTTAITRSAVSAALRLRFYAQLFHGVGGVADTGGVNEPQEGSAAGDSLLHRVPGGAGNVGDDGPVIARQGV